MRSEVKGVNSWSLKKKSLKRESKFKGHIFEVAVDEVLLPDGKTAGRELIFHKGAVAVLAVTPEGKSLS